MHQRTVHGIIFCATAALAMGAAMAGGRVELPFQPGNFSSPLNISNPYLPMVPGTTFRYAAEVEDGCEVTETTITAGVRTILGVDARVVEDLNWFDEECDGVGDVLLEETDDWFAQDDDGNVWYMGEWTTSYFDDDGNPVVSHEGSWEAGVGGAQAGIMMLADPTPGLFYRQEFSEGVAEDMAKVTRLNAFVSSELGDYEDCLKTKEWTTLDPGAIEHKYYCPGLGLVLVEELKSKTVYEKLVEVVPPAP